MCCRANSGPATNSSDAAGYWATLGRCDVPLHTVEQIISYIKREIAPDIVLWLGDTVYASPYNVSKESERAVLSTVTRLIKSAFPSSVFPILGNHEGSPSDMFDFHHVDREQWLLDLTGGLWSDWLHPAALKQFMQTGYYTQLVPGHPRLRVVALNLFLYSDNNMYTNYNSTDPLAQIRWLSETLAKAEQAGERVLVITHVPTCADRGTEGTILFVHSLRRRHRPDDDSLRAIREYHRRSLRGTLPQGLRPGPPQLPRRLSLRPRVRLALGHRVSPRHPKRS